MSPIIRVNIITAGGSGSIVWGIVFNRFFQRPNVSSMKNLIRGLGLVSNANNNNNSHRQVYIPGARMAEVVPYVFCLSRKRYWL